MRLPVVAALLVLNGCGTSPGSGDNTGHGGALPDDSGTQGLDTATDLGAPDLGAPDLTPPRQSPIAAENQLPGDSGWKLSASSAGLYGFADRLSYLPGAVVEIHAAADAATPANWTLYRLGYYGGAGARRIDGGAASIPKATAAVIDPSTGMVSAPWPTTFTIPLDGALITGVYLVKLTSPSAQSWVIFVVREAARGAPIVWPLAFTTYAAYEAWGGTSLYDNTRSDWSSWHAYAVSFDRPFLQGNGAGGFPFADRDLLTFAEGQGYDIDYVADTDVDADPAELAGRRLVVLQGHSEYWSAGERDALEAALAAGTSTVVFGANDLYWQVRYAPSAAGVPRRVVIGYKEFAARDPAQTGDPAHVTTQWRMLGKPENALLGVMFGDWLWSSVPFTIGDPSSWIWSGANVVAGTMIPGLYGFEVDRRYDNGAEPAGLVELGRGLGENHNGVTSAGQATLYQLPSGATVFASGTVSWSQALADAGQCDARVQQATHNLFARLAGSGVVGAAPAALKLPDGPPPPQQLGGVQVATVTTALTAPAAVAALPGGDVAVVDGDRVVRVTPAGVVSPLAGGARGDADGTPGAFAGPRGLCAGPDGTLYVADTGNDKVKKIAGGVVTTLAGSTAGFADGVLGKGQLDQPMSIALTPSGTLV
ncbi:MAG: N,N-dimethylformamidase beta subunit family domain-containing protein, partial [Polyangia bacterium]